MRSLLTVLTVGILLLPGCAIYWVKPPASKKLGSGLEVEVQVMERVGLFGNDWFAGVLEMCQPEDGGCVQQTFHGHGGAIANYAAYGAVAAAIWPGTLINNDVTTVSKNSIDESLSLKFWQNQTAVQWQGQSQSLKVIGD